MSILVAKNISKYYNTISEKINVLHSINLSIKKGEIIIIKGESGSGKTTLLNIIGLLDTFDKGELIIDGIKINNKTKNKSKLRLEKIGFIFQYHHLLREFTVLENLLIPQLLNNKKINEKNKCATDNLKYIKMIEMKNRFPAQLSGGEKQRIAIIRALINNPKIILADEPTGNLDQANTKNIMKIIYNLSRDKNMTYIIATHDDEFKQIADKVFHLKNGVLET